MGLKATQLQERVLTHEIGHAAFRMSDVGAVNGACSEVQTIMYASGSVLTGCGVTAPESSCDSSTISSIYPASPAYCPSGSNNFCYDGYYSCN